MAGNHLKGSFSPRNNSHLLHWGTWVGQKGLPLGGLIRWHYVREGDGEPFRTIGPSKWAFLTSLWHLAFLMAVMATFYNFIFPCRGDLGQDHKQSCGLWPVRCERVTNRRAHAHPDGADVAQLLLIVAKRKHLRLFSREAGKSGFF